MEAKIGKFFESAGSIFAGGDNIPWCDRDIIAGCEREVAEAATEEQKNDSLMRLSWALVHSKQQDDVNRGIGMIEASLDKSSSSLQTREKLYLLAVGATEMVTIQEAGNLWTIVWRFNLIGGRPYL